mmetsp:Transcript_84760/g.240074  ORF Transcript_84760/g.240074 Transcript_84760/m.240074 type:complete len:219 (+) Transcript_84760:689-1345(+)
MRCSTAALEGSGATAPLRPTSGGFRLGGTTGPATSERPGVLPRATSAAWPAGLPAPRARAPHGAAPWRQRPPSCWGCQRHLRFQRLLPEPSEPAPNRGGPPRGAGGGASRQAPRASSLSAGQRRPSAPSTPRTEGAWGHPSVALRLAQEPPSAPASQAPSRGARLRVRPSGGAPPRAARARRRPSARWWRPKSPRTRRHPGRRQRRTALPWGIAWGPR